MKIGMYLHPAPCDHTFSGFLRVESKHFRPSLIFSPICEYGILSIYFLHRTYSEMPFDVVLMNPFAWIHEKWTHAIQLSACLRHTQSLYTGFAFSKGSSWVGVFPPPTHLRTEADPVSGTLCFLISRIADDGKSQNNSNSVCYAPSSEPFIIYLDLNFKKLIESKIILQHTFLWRGSEPWVDGNEL
jgi:hypothetical protein